jgi:hypothetical protein
VNEDFIWNALFVVSTITVIGVFVFVHYAFNKAVPNTLKKLILAKRNYIKNNLYICNSGILTKPMKIIFCLAFIGSFSLFLLDGFTIQAIQLFLIISTSAILPIYYHSKHKGAVIKLEGKILTLDIGSESLTYDVNFITDIRCYKKRDEGRNSRRYKIIYIYSKGMGNEHCVDGFLLDDIRILCYLVPFVRNEKLEDIELLTINEFEDVIIHTERKPHKLY